MTDHYAVIGNPVSHSLSPRIHALFAQSSGQDMDYDRLEAPLDSFALRARNFFLAGGKGLNVTVPFKQEAFALAESLSAQATLAGAVNTLAPGLDGGLYGHNTDGLGLVADITHNLGQSLQGASILVIGAGGATRGILQPLLEQRPDSVLVANRTAARATELAAIFAGHGKVSGCGLDDVPEAGFDWVINASAASLQGEVPAIPDQAVGTQSRCYDLMYGAEPTAFCRWASERGATLVSDGLGMLVEQAAESFKLWRGLRPQTAGVITTLRDGLQSKR